MGCLPVIPRARLVVAAGLVLGLLSLLAAHGTWGPVAYLAPALLLLAVLALRRYPGERALLALRHQRGRRRRRVGVRAAPVRPRPRGVLPRGGRLIASSLAVRPPPVPAAAAIT